MTVINPTGDNELLGDAVAMRKIGRLERFLGPDNYRVIQGLFKTPAAVMGTVLIMFFVLIALLAPVLAPPLTDDPYKIPRDGFKAEPKPMGEVWNSRPPPLPFWWKAVTGKDEWVHIFGTAQGQYDIYYGVI